MGITPVSNNKRSDIYEKRLISSVLALSMVFGTGALLPEGFSFQSVVTSQAEVYGDYEYTVLDDGTVGIAKYMGSDTEVTIPSKIDGKSVTSIGDWAFSYCTSLTSITIFQHYKKTYTRKTTKSITIISPA